MPSIPFLVCIVGVAGLFYLNREKEPRTSGALWIAVVWLWILGSRPPELWLGLGGGGQDIDATLEGDSTQAAIFTTLIVAGISVLFGRKRQTTACLKNAAVLTYFAYCLVSCFWSPFPGVALKRWIKSTGDLVLVLLILTDPEPIVALRRAFSRVGFVLFPLSVYLIHYTYLGRTWDPWGRPTNIGVTTNKNNLGMLTFLIAIGAVWNVIELLRSSETANRGRRLLAQGTLLAFGIVLLYMAHSATSVACFILGSTLMLATSLRAIRRSPARMHALILTVAIAAGISTTIGGDELAVHSLGRETNLTGRTDIWKAVLPMAGNPVVGVGFESFWNARSAQLKRFRGDLGTLLNGLNSAHNGYIDVYLNIGGLGVFLIATILISGYLRIGRTFKAHPEVGSLFLAYLFPVALYNMTEAGFRILTLSWIFLLLAVVGATGMAGGRLMAEPPAQPHPGPNGVREPELGWGDALLVNR